MNKSCNIDITHVISDQVRGNVTIIKSILHDPSGHVISKLYICRIASTCQLSCNANINITPHRINTKPHNCAMFSPTTSATILNCRNLNCGQEQSSSVNSTRRTSPRLQHAAIQAMGVLVVKVYRPVEQLNPGGAGDVLTLTLHPLQ
jgi:hypothetical protein